LKSPTFEAVKFQTPKGKGIDMLIISDFVLRSNNEEFGITVYIDSH